LNTIIVIKKKNNQNNLYADLDSAKLETFCMGIFSIIKGDRCQTPRLGQVAFHMTNLMKAIDEHDYRMQFNVMPEGEILIYFFQTVGCLLFK